MSINCIFCNKSCVREAKTASTYNCNNHPYKVNIYTDLNRRNIEWCTFSIVEDSKSYDFSWFYPNGSWPFNYDGTAMTNEFSVAVSTEGDVLMAGDIILHLPHHPNGVTPENAHEKLKIWLALL